MLRVLVFVESVHALYHTMTRHAICMSLCSCCATMFFLATQDASGKVVAHWRFQHAVSGDVAQPSQLIRDSSGNDRPDHAVGQPKYRAVELADSNLGVVFDGVDDRIAVPDHPLFYLPKSLTIEAFVQINKYPMSTAKLSHIVFRGDDRLSFDPWYLAVMESGQLKFLVTDALNKGSDVLSPEPLPTDKMLHVAAVFDDATGKQSLFVNGQMGALKETTIRACGKLGGDRPGIGIGNRQTHSNQGFRGMIAELRISDQALGPKGFLPFGPISHTVDPKHVAKERALARRLSTLGITKESLMRRQEALKLRHEREPKTPVAREIQDRIAGIQRDIDLLTRYESDP